VDFANDPRVYTWIVIGVLLFLAGAWDLFALLTWGKEATISYILRNLAVDYPVFPFLLGILAGHIFWSLKFPPAK
jgi:hypothetical protein